MHNELPIITKTYELYKTFYTYSVLFPKKDKYTIGKKCEIYILTVLEYILATSNSTTREKVQLLKQANIKFDTLKIFLRLLKDIKIIDEKKYIILQKQIQEIGRMLGGWQKSLF